MREESSHGDRSILFGARAQARMSWRGWAVWAFAAIGWSAWLALAGCGVEPGPVEKVKQARLAGEELPTVAEAFDQYRLCANVGFELLEDRGGRAVVSANCELALERLQDGGALSPAQVRSLLEMLRGVRLSTSFVVDDKSGVRLVNVGLAVQPRQGEPEEMGLDATRVLRAVYDNQPAAEAVALLRTFAGE